MNQQRLAASITDVHLGRAPESGAPASAGLRPASPENPETHLEYLSAAVEASEPALFLDYIGWARVVLAGLGFPEKHLERSLDATRVVLAAELADAPRSVAIPILEEASRALPALPLVTPSPIQGSNPHAELAFRYVSALLDGDRRHAGRLILDAVEGCVPVRDIYLHVVSPAQHEIGRLWQMSRISVAQEHYCTAATQQVMSRLYPGSSRHRASGCASSPPRSAASCTSSARAWWPISSRWQAGTPITSARARRSPTSSERSASGARSSSPSRRP